MDKEKKQACYIGMTKRGIGLRKKEHQQDLREGKLGTALGRLNMKEKIKVDFNGIQKLAEYNNHSYALIREALEIRTNRGAVNDVAHADVDEGWDLILKGTRGKYKQLKKDLK